VDAILDEFVAEGPHESKVWLESMKQRTWKMFLELKFVILMSP
jgi:hypothetical protein